jgi:hypothetical protein
MRFIISMLFALALALAAWQVSLYLKQSMERRPGVLAPVRAPAPAPAPAPPPAGGQLPGLPPRLQPALEAAQQRGAAGLRDFLAANGANVADPRLAWIQLDYVLVVAPGDPVEARKVFAQVKARLAPGSPVFARMKQLEKTYE